MSDEKKIEEPVVVPTTWTETHCEVKDCPRFVRAREVEGGIPDIGAFIAENADKLPTCKSTSSKCLVQLAKKAA